MDSVIISLIFAGATIVLLSVFVAASERELRKKRRELASLAAKLEESRERTKELERRAAPLDVGATEPSFDQSRAEMEERFAALATELADSREKLHAFDAIHRQLLDLEQKYEKALLDNSQLQQEISRWQERLAHSEDTQRRLGILGQHMDDSKITEETPNGKIQENLAGMADLLEIIPRSHPSTPAEMMSQSAGAMGTVAVTVPEHPNDHPGSEYDRESGYETDRGPADDARRQTLSGRAEQLAALRASVRLCGAEAYRETIDSLKILPDLSETEREIVRDIFLTRADEAQRCGRDTDMLRYRNWAKNIVYHTALDNEVPCDENDAAQSMSQSTVTGGPTSVETNTALTEVTGNETAASKSGAPAGKSPARKVLLGIGIGLGLILILLIHLFLDTSPENTVASDRASMVLAPGTGRPRSTESPSETNLVTAGERNSAENDSRPVREPAGTVVENEQKASLRKTPATATKIMANRVAKQEPVAVPRAQSVWGAYSIVKRTQVYKEPSESSALVAAIDAGTEVNVVSARNGWYEIRSKTGRPPGFIRQEHARRLR